ncbi:WYL domain-containing protein [Oerskovia sp. M15]
MSFTYRAASTGEVRTRTVEPWRIAARRGGWYLLGFDRERQAPRAYRLSRIEGRVRLLGRGGSFTIPEGGRGRAPGCAGRAGAAGEPRDRPRAGRGVAGPRAQRRRRGEPAQDGRDVVHVAFTNQHTFADEIAGYGDAVVVLSPRAARRRRAPAAGRGPPGRRPPQDDRSTDRVETTRTEEQRG